MSENHEEEDNEPVDPVLDPGNMLLRYLPRVIVYAALRYGLSLYYDDLIPLREQRIDTYGIFRHLYVEPNPFETAISKKVPAILLEICAPCIETCLMSDMLEGSEGETIFPPEVVEQAEEQLFSVLNDLRALGPITFVRSIHLQGSSNRGSMTDNLFQSLKDRGYQNLLLTETDDAVEFLNNLGVEKEEEIDIGAGDRIVRMGILDGEDPIPLDEVLEVLRDYFQSIK